VDDSSRVHLKTVQVGNTTETASVILGGLSDGDRVVVDGTDRLVEGAVVRVRKAGEMDNPPGYEPGGGGGRGGRGGRGASKKGGTGSGQGEGAQGRAEPAGDSDAGSGRGGNHKGGTKKGRRGGATQ
jgi:multidrug efflux system membrane fusion protein